MISHRHKCVFVHVPKTAGQSIEHVFLGALKLTWETRAGLLIRRNDNPEMGPPRLAHLRAVDYVRCGHITSDEFQTYYKFSFVRNPWDRMISLYKHLGFSRRVEFKTFLVKELRKRVYERKFWFVRPQADFIFDDNGDLVVNFVGRFERLDEDFGYVCKRIDLPEGRLPHINRSSDKNRKHVFDVKEAFSKPDRIVKQLWRLYRRGSTPAYERYEGYYDDEAKELVEELYKADVNLLGYRYGQGGALPALHRALKGPIGS
jgi:hypothetical protein